MLARPRVSCSALLLGRCLHLYLAPHLPAGHAQKHVPIEASTGPVMCAPTLTPYHGVCTSSPCGALGQGGAGLVPWPF